MEPVDILGLTFRSLERLGILGGGIFLLVAGCRVLNVEINRRKMPPQTTNATFGVGRVPTTTTTTTDPLAGTEVTGIPQTGASASGSQFYANLTGLTQGAVVVLLGIITLNVASLKTFEYHSVNTREAFKAPKAPAELPPAGSSADQPSPKVVTPLGPKPALNLATDSKPIEALGGSADGGSAMKTRQTDITIIKETEKIDVNYSGGSNDSFATFAKLLEENLAIFQPTVPSTNFHRAVWKLEREHASLLCAEYERRKEQALKAGTEEKKKEAERYQNYAKFLSNLNSPAFNDMTYELYRDLPAQARLLVGK